MPHNHRRISFEMRSTAANLVRCCKIDSSIAFPPSDTHYTDQQPAFRQISPQSRTSFGLPKQQAETSKKLGLRPTMHRNVVPAQQ